MRDLRTRIDGRRESPQPQDVDTMAALADLGSLVTLLDAEGLESVVLSQCHEERAGLFARLGDTASQFRCLREARKVRNLCIGAFHPYSIALGLEIADLARQLGYR